MRQRAEATRTRDSRPGLHRVEQVMGTAVGIHVRDTSPVAPAVLDEVFAYLRHVDATFSTYRPESEVSRLGRGEIAEVDCSDEVRLVLALCDDLARTSDGYFDARRHRADGIVDPTGLVKGWSIEEAAWMIDAAGGRDFHVNAGGDIVARGQAAPGRGWRVGIRHPWRHDRVAAVLVLEDLSIATSGAYERGAHIVDPHTGAAADELLSVSVVGPSLTYADAYATTAFAMGSEGLPWVAGHPGYGAVGITRDERLVWTPLVDRLFA